MYRKLFSFFLSLLLLVGIVSVVTTKSISAQESTMEPNSFEMFWPLVAGKSMGDSLYFLKTIKENLRGAVIFGANSKADYEVFLVTKRVLEAEKLIKEGKVDFSKKTLQIASSKLDLAIKSIDTAKANGTAINSMEMPGRLTNLITLSKWLSEKYLDTHDLFLQISEKSSALLLKI